MHAVPARGALQFGEAGVGRCGQMWGDVGRCGEIEGRHTHLHLGEAGDEAHRGDVGRCGEMWGDRGEMHTCIWGKPVMKRIDEKKPTAESRDESTCD